MSMICVGQQDMSVQRSRLAVSCRLIHYVRMKVCALTDWPEWLPWKFDHLPMIKQSIESLWMLSRLTSNDVSKDGMILQDLESSGLRSGSMSPEDSHSSYKAHEHTGIPEFEVTGFRFQPQENRLKARPRLWQIPVHLTGTPVFRGRENRLVTW